MKPIVIDPKTTTRASAYELWMSAPNPMVTFFKTLDVTPLVRFSRKHGYKFNMLLCWCIGKAASEIKEFYLLPVGRELLKYDNIAVNTIVKNKTGEVSSCDVPFSDDIARFNADYLRLTRAVAESCENHDLTDSMVIGTSAIIDTEIDGAVGMNSGIFNNPFIIWAESGKKSINRILNRKRPAFSYKTDKFSLQLIWTKWSFNFGLIIAYHIKARIIDSTYAMQDKDALISTI